MMQEKVVTEITSYSGDTYQKVELAHSTFYHRIKKKGDIAYTPRTTNMYISITEVDRLTAENRTLTAERLVMIGQIAELDAELTTSNSRVERLREAMTSAVEKLSNVPVLAVNEAGAQVLGLAAITVVGIVKEALADDAKEGM